MAQFIKETVTTQGNTNQENTLNSTSKSSAKATVTTQETVERVIYFLFGILEVLLAFRLLLKLTGASMASGFVSAIYSLTGVFILPFEGIFRRWLTPGAETTAVFEPSTLVAIIVYAVLVWGVIKLMSILSGQKESES